MAAAAAAASSTAVATARFSSSATFRTSKGTRVAPFSVKFPCRRRVGFVIIRSSSSSEVSAEETNSNTEETGEFEEETQVDQVPDGPPSLISALNIEKALRGIAITDVDHYGRLGLPRGCSYDQVPLAYKSKVEELMKQQLPEEELQSNIELLKESYFILSSVEERRLYDWSLARNDNPERYTWPFEVDITQTPTGSPPPQEPEDTGPTRLVGYFIFGWFILSIILSIAFNR